MKILVTGASGFIGRALVEMFSTQGHEVVPFRRQDGLIEDESSWAHLEPTKVVIHLAARSYVPDSWLNPEEFLRVNTMGTLQALNYCRKNHAKLIYLSSYLYGREAQCPISEEAGLEAFNPYALSKKQAEELCRFYADYYEVQTVVLRAFNLYGKGQPGHFLIPTIIQNVSAGLPIKVKDLAPRRDYVYLEDVLNAISLACHLEQSFSVFNIGSGTSHSVAEVIQTIQSVWGTNLPVESSSESRVMEVMDTQADISKAARILGWRPRVTLTEGLTQMVLGIGRTVEAPEIPM